MVQYISGRKFAWGTSIVTALPSMVTNGDTTAIFYKWPDASLTYNLHPYYFSFEGNITADYKTKYKTTTVEALKYSPQTKAIKDTNGVTNLVYESMEGIFYTRTKPDGSFKCEEIVSGNEDWPYQGYATSQNSNPFIAEIKSWASGGNSVYPEENIVVVWERREGNDIKIYKSDRWIIQPFGDIGWSKELLATISNAPTGFKCFPKVVQAAIEGTSYFDYGVVTYLKPESGNNKSIQGVYFTDNGVYPAQTLVSAGNISDYSVAFVFSPVDKFHLHIVYSKDNTINYRHSHYNPSWGWDPYLGGEDWVVSNNEVQNYRYTPDISVRNGSTDPVNHPSMQPVVSYQGQYRTRIIIGGGGTDQQTTDGTYYPIIIRERSYNHVTQATSWATYNIQYNSLTNQQNPNIEGSKTRNSYIVNYSQNNATFLQKVPKWEGQAPNAYFCSPGSYSGKDAKFVKGALVNQSSSSQALITLATSGNLYQVGKQPFSITNQQGIGGGTDGSFDGVNGVVISDNMKYSFNLGSVMVNSNMVYFNGYLDSTIDNISDLNSNMTSCPFYLNNNDTLVLGRDAYYFASDSNHTFRGIEYWVDLMNKSKGKLVQNLIHDTIHVDDTINLDYLDGFIIQGIKSDSFYVQLRIDTLFNSTGIGGGAIIGDGGASGLGGTRFAIQKKIFWHDGRKENVISIPTSFNLCQNFPNPFNPVTTIKYDLPKDVNVSIKVYDLLGREVTELVKNEFKKAGRYEANWNANNYASGVYIYRLEAGDYVSTKKMVLIK